MKQNRFATCKQHQYVCVWPDHIWDYGWPCSTQPSGVLSNTCKDNNRTEYVPRKKREEKKKLSIRKKNKNWFNLILSFSFWKIKENLLTNKKHIICCWKVENDYFILLFRFGKTLHGVKTKAKEKQQWAHWCCGKTFLITNILLLFWGKLIKIYLSRFWEKFSVFPHLRYAHSNETNCFLSCSLLLTDFQFLQIVTSFQFSIGNGKRCIHLW